jgi:hypothetical protein
MLMSIPRHMCSIRGKCAWLSASVFRSSSIPAQKVLSEQPVAKCAVTKSEIKPSFSRMTASVRVVGIIRRMDPERSRRKRIAVSFGVIGFCITINEPMWGHFSLQLLETADSSWTKMSWHCSSRSALAVKVFHSWWGRRQAFHETATHAPRYLARSRCRQLSLASTSSRIAAMLRLTLSAPAWLQANSPVLRSTLTNKDFEGRVPAPPGLSVKMESDLRQSATHSSPIRSCTVSRALCQRK